MTGEQGAKEISLLEAANYPEHEWHYPRIYASSGNIGTGFFLPGFFRATIPAPGARDALRKRAV